MPRDVARETEGPVGDAILSGAKAVRGSLSMSGVGGTLGVDSSVRGSARRASVKIKGSGPWGLASGARRHEIKPTGGRRAVVTPKGPRASVNHPGTRRVDVWGKATKHADRKVTAAVDKAADAAVRKVLD